MHHPTEARFGAYEDLTTDELSALLHKQRLLLARECGLAFTSVLSRTNLSRFVADQPRTEKAIAAYLGANSRCATLPAVFLHALRTGSSISVRDHARFVRREQAKRAASASAVPTWQKLRADARKPSAVRMVYSRAGQAAAPSPPVDRGQEAELSAQIQAFYGSYEWKAIRYRAFAKYGNHCQVCGRGREHGVVMNVDHVKPIRLFPMLALDIRNLQVLCSDCNHGKGNRAEDWRG